MLRFDGLLTGSFAWIGADGFSAGGNTEARFSDGVLQLDADGDGLADVTISLTGLTSASQLSSADFLFV